MQPQLPEGFRFAPHLAQSYEKSGWCHVEAAISAVIKHGKRRLDLSRRQGHDITIYDNNNSDAIGTDLVPTCAASRLVPTLPDEMARRLEHELTFTNGKSDADKVAALYRNFFDAVATSVERLSFTNLGWGVAEVEALASAMPRFPSCVNLDLSGNCLSGAEGGAAVVSVITASVSITAIGKSGLHLKKNKLGVEGWTVIFDALRDSPNSIATCNLHGELLGADICEPLAEYLSVSESITSLDLTMNFISSDGAEELAAGLAANGSLKQLVLRNTAVMDDGAIAIGHALIDNTNCSIEELSLHSCAMGDGGAKAIAAFCIVSTSLKSLALGDNHIRVEGAKALAVSLDANSSLTALEARHNNLMGDEGKHLLQQAAKGREGFDLRL